MNDKKKVGHLAWRYYFILCLLCIMGLVLVWRLIYLTVIDQSFLRTQGNARTLRVINIPAFRGIITDRNGQPLAVSTPVQSVWVDPNDFSADEEQYHRLASLLLMSESALKHRIHDQPANSAFVYLKRQINPSIANQIAVLEIPGIHLQQEFRRYYPEGEVTAQLLGFTNIDDKGQAGIELEYDNWLRGETGKKQVLVDRLGQVVEDVCILKAANAGHNVTLSIDRRLQYLAYRELKKAVVDSQAQSGSVVILQPKTGEVLAMANYPSFNPNQRLRDNSANQRNRAVTDVFEPGSTMKTFSIVSALESGQYQPDTKVRVSPGWLRIGKNTVRDERDLGTIDLTTILQHSSNVGIAKVTLSLPSEQLPNLLYKVGVGRRTTSGFPGESAGTIQPIAPWQKFSLATLAFGYGLSMTNLQLAQAYAILAANGVKYPITLLRVDQLSHGDQILTPRVTQETVNMLESVVRPGGTATRAQIKGYRVAGKTGTVRLLGPQGYEKDHHIALFVGLAPVSNPQFVVSVVIRDPKKNYYGGYLAAPVFSRIVSNALRIWAISPDELSNQNR